MTDQPEILYLRSGQVLPKRALLVKNELENLGEEGLFGLFNQISYYTQTGNSQSPKVFYNDIDLNQFKVIFFRIVGGEWQLARLICQYLEKKINTGKVRIVDPIFVTGKKYLAAKLCQTLALKQAGLPVPKTYFGNALDFFDRPDSCFSFPVIIKGSTGSQGKKVFLAENKKNFDKLVDRLNTEYKKEKFIFQEFIPNQGDIRFYVLGGEVILAVNRVRTNMDDFRNNLSQGAKAYIVNPDKKIKNIAIKAAQAAQLGFAGVDIAFRQSDNQPFILEVNRSPSFRSTIKLKELGVNIPRRIARYLIKFKKEAG